MVQRFVVAVQQDLDETCASRHNHAGDLVIFK
jgi:hypothetical protein